MNDYEKWVHIHAYWWFEHAYIHTYTWSMNMGLCYSMHRKWFASLNLFVMLKCFLLIPSSSFYFYLFLFYIKSKPRYTVLSATHYISFLIKFKYLIVSTNKYIKYNYYFQDNLYIYIYIVMYLNSIRGFNQYTIHKVMYLNFTLI